jgi:hypothetical protein
MHYTDLHRILASLEAQIGTAPPHGFPRPAQVRAVLAPAQGFALSNDTVGRDLDVVVAVGANYTQGNVRTPRDTFSSATAVEDNLKACRKRVAEALCALSATWVNAGKASSQSLSFGGEYHLVMTNFCLWNTEIRWQRIDPKRRADLLAHNPSFGGGTTSAPHWQHLTQLHAALVSSSPLWIAHGIHSEVFSLFQPFAASLGLKRWMMTPNLSYRYFHYGKHYPRP